MEGFIVSEGDVDCINHVVGSYVEGFSSGVIYDYDTKFFHGLKFALDGKASQHFVGGEKLWQK